MNESGQDGVPSKEPQPNGGETSRPNPPGAEGQGRRQQRPPAGESTPPDPDNLQIDEVGRGRELAEGEHEETKESQRAELAALLGEENAAQGENIMRTLDAVKGKMSISDEEAVMLSTSFAGMSREQAGMIMDTKKVNPKVKEKILASLPEDTKKPENQTDEEKAEVMRLGSRATGMRNGLEESIADLKQKAKAEKSKIRKEFLNGQIKRFESKMTKASDWMSVPPKEWAMRVGKFALIASIIALAFLIWEAQLIGKMAKK